jgi:hypothetical protein
MRCHIAVILLLALTTSVAATTEVTLEDYLQFDAMVRLADATSREELERARGEIVGGDSAVDIVYALALYKLEPSAEAEKLLLDSIPSSELEFTFFFIIMYQGRCAVDAPPKLCSLPDEYLPKLAQVVARHPCHCGAFLRLSYFADGYVKTDLNRASQYLFEANREAFKQALAAIRPEIARTVDFEDSSPPEE